MRLLRDPLIWLILFFIAFVTLLPLSGPLFASGFPELERPVYQQDSFWQLTLAHIELVALSGTIAVVAGMGCGIVVTRPAGKAFRSTVETLVAAGQTFPPVAVLAVAVPLIGFGKEPAVIALVLYGLLPILQGTLAGITAVPASVREIAEGAGMTPWQVLLRVELPLAAPVIIAGIRTSTIVNIGTAAIASTVGAKTLGSPVIIGLSGFNTAWIIQGACLMALLAVITDRLFERLLRQFRNE